MTSELLRRVRRTCGLVLGGAFVIGNPQCGPPAADHLQLAAAYLEMGRDEQALLEVRRARRQDGPSAEGVLLAAYARLNLDQPEAALEAVLEGLARWPAEARLHRVLRELCARDQVFEEPRRRLESLLAVAGTTDLGELPAELLATVGWLRAATGDRDGAVPLLRRAAATPAGDAFASLQLARVLDQLQQPAEALRALEDALLALPDAPDVLLAAGAARLRQGAYAPAAEAFERLLSGAPLPRQEAIRAAMACYEAGAPEWAARYYERALGLGDAEPLSRNNLAWTYAELGRSLDRALALALQAVKMDPDNPVYLDTYAEVYFRLGQADRAVAIARQALEAEPADGENQGHLARQLARFMAAVPAGGQPTAPRPRER